MKWSRSRISPTSVRNGTGREPGIVRSKGDEFARSYTRRTPRRRKAKRRRSTVLGRVYRITNRGRAEGLPVHRWRGARESLEIARRPRVAYCRRSRPVHIGQDQGSTLNFRPISSRSSADSSPEARCSPPRCLTDAAPPSSTRSALVPRTLSPRWRSSSPISSRSRSLCRTRSQFA